MSTNMTRVLSGDSGFGTGSSPETSPQKDSNAEEESHRHHLNAIEEEEEEFMAYRFRKIATGCSEKQNPQTADGHVFFDGDRYPVHVVLKPAAEQKALTWYQFHSQVEPCTFRRANGPLFHTTPGCQSFLDFLEGIIEKMAERRLYSDEFKYVVFPALVHALGQQESGIECQEGTSASFTLTAWHEREDVAELFEHVNSSSKVKGGKAYPNGIIVKNGATKILCELKSTKSFSPDQGLLQSLALLNAHSRAHVLLVEPEAAYLMRYELNAEGLITRDQEAFYIFNWSRNPVMAKQALMDLLLAMKYILNSN